MVSQLILFIGLFCWPWPGYESCQMPVWVWKTKLVKFSSFSLVCMCVFYYTLFKNILKLASVRNDECFLGHKALHCKNLMLAFSQMYTSECFKLCIIISHTELCTFIPVSVTFSWLQSHRGNRKVKIKMQVLCIIGPVGFKLCFCC